MSPNDKPTDCFQTVSRPSGCAVYNHRSDLTGGSYCSLAPILESVELLLVLTSDVFCHSRLALYVYEYLLHIGAQKAAQTFLNEIRWEKNITLGEPPGFLHSWWW